MTDEPASLTTAPAGYADWLLDLTIMVLGSTPEDERDFGVEGSG